MTAYNRERFIGEAIESVLASSFRDFEFIIVDDFSTDRTLSIAEEFAKNDKRISVYANDENLGQFENRNKAASLAVGKYLKYVDSDDRIKPETLQIMLDGMESDPDAGIGVVYTNYQKVDFSAKPFMVIKSKDALIWHYCNGGLLFPGPTGCIFKTKSFFLNKGFPLDLGINGDIYLNIKIGANEKTVLFPGHLVYWRKHDQQVDEMQQDFFKMHKERFLINQRLLKTEGLPLTTNELERITFSIKILYIRGALKNYALKGHLRKFRKLLQAVDLSLFNLVFVGIPLRLITPFRKRGLMN